MGKFLPIIVGTLLGLFCAIPISSADIIHSFDASITIENGRSPLVIVEETIVYDFGELPGHGIYRDIYETHDGNTTILSVTDEKGIPYKYETYDYYAQTSLKIGDPHVEITGPQTYVIQYEVAREISYFEGWDELYWNVTGTEWGIEIERASATVTLNEPTDKDELQATCYSGFYGKSEGNCEATFASDKNMTVFSFETTNRLETNYYTNEKLTIVAGFPKGIFHEPLPWEAKLSSQHVKTFLEKILTQIPFIILAIIIFYLAYFTWKKHGNDPGPKAPVVAIYKPPNNLTAAEMEVFLTGKLTPRSLTATLFELGVMNLLSVIDYNAKTGEPPKEKPELAFLKKDKPASAKLSEFQDYAYSKIFGVTNTKRTVKSLKYKFSGYKSYQSKIIKSLKESGYYETPPGNWYSFYLVFVGVLMLIPAFVISMGLSHEFKKSSYIYASIAVITAALGAIGFGFYMTKKTITGVALEQAIKGFKLYLSVSEKERLAFHNPPAKTIEHFEKMLPYAVALGVEKNWVKSFKDLISQMPTDNHLSTWWTYGDFDTANLTKAMSSIQGTTSPKPSSGSYSGSSSSGFSSGGFSSGGGFSGGGGGGGGGGRW